MLTQFWELEARQVISPSNPDLWYVSVGDLPFHPLRIIICPMLLYNTDCEFPAPSSRRSIYPESLLLAANDERTGTSKFVTLHGFTMASQLMLQQSTG